LYAGLQIAAGADAPPAMFVAPVTAAAGLYCTDVAALHWTGAIEVAMLLM